MSYIDPEKRYSKQLYSYAMSFRSIALLVDQDPNEIYKYTHLEAIDFLVSDNNSTTSYRTKYLEALSYGDPGVLLASPGPSLSGIAIRELGNQDQKNNFFKEVKTKKIQTFFGLTEPAKGSDAANLSASITKTEKRNLIRLSGEKCFCGNLAAAKMGVIFARQNNSIAGITALWLTPDILESKLVQRQDLEHKVLRGARLGYMSFNNAELNEDRHLLGQHLSPLKRGVLAFSRIFNQYRTGVAAIALGQAQAVVDFLFEQDNSTSFVSKNKLHILNDKLAYARLFLYHSACEVDKNPESGVSASMAKIDIIRCVDFVLSTIFEAIPITLILEFPWLMKAFRDRYCWEFMEGTSDVLMGHVSSGINAKLSEFNKINKEDIYV